MFLRSKYVALSISFFLGALMACTVAQDTKKGESPATQSQDEKNESKTNDKVLGISKTKPESGPYVKIEGGYMVPYTTTIPGTKIEYTMVPIQGGKFMMGSPEDEDGRNKDEGPQVEVNVKPFWMGRYEVTWAEYKMYMKLDKVFKAFVQKKVRQVTEENKVDAITAPSALYDPSFTFEAGEEPTEPAASMTQFAAKQYTKWLSGMTGDFYRLPYESEWEYACRAGTTTAYYFGDDPDELEEHGWFYDNSDEYRHDCGMFPPNPWGLYDMYGNVSEWVLDQYSEDGYKANAGKSVTVAQSFNKPTKLFPRVVRGGSFESEEASECRSAARLGSDDEEWKDEDPNVPASPWWYTTTPGLGVGFRLVRPLDVPTKVEEKLAVWDADLEDIDFDARNRISDNGRGAYGIVDKDLPKAISELTDADK